MLYEVKHNSPKAEERIQNAIRNHDEMVKKLYGLLEDELACIQNHNAHCVYAR